LTFYVASTHHALQPLCLHGFVYIKAVTNSSQDHESHILSLLFSLSSKVRRM